MSGKALLGFLQDHGFVIIRINGSHYILQMDERIVSVPVHGSRDLPPGTLNRILKDAGLKK